MDGLVFYVNQVPAEKLAFKIVDEGRRPRNLNAYSNAEVYFVDPDGETITGGSALIADRANGIVNYTFPAQTLFTKRGQYEVQVKLIAGTREDYTDVETIHVINSLEA